MALIVCVDDDLSILELLKINLEMWGHRVLTAADGEKGVALVLQNSPQLVILDVMMPGLDGYSVAQRIRNRELSATLPAVPILMLTALGVVQDKVRGFDAGADDYLVKPFEIPELQVRVRALLRRYQPTGSSTALKELLSVGHITLLPENLEAQFQQHTVKLTPTEFEILNALLQRHGQAVSLAKLLQEVWGYAPDDDVETIRVHVRHLRAKLEKVCPEIKYIETIYGGGYRLHPEGRPPA
jgi:two-component system, OmpR family, response regulator RpaA